MSRPEHTFAKNCRLAPVSHPAPSDNPRDAPPITAQFFYTSILPIDDPLSHGTLAGAAEARSVKGRLRPFAKGDNNALERAWLSTASREDGAAHQEAIRKKKLSPPIVESMTERKALLVRTIALNHFRKHKGDVLVTDASIFDSAAQPTTPALACCPELYLDVSSELQNTFCAVARKKLSHLKVETVVSDIMMELRTLHLEATGGEDKIPDDVPTTSMGSPRDQPSSVPRDKHSPAMPGVTGRIRSSSRATVDSQRSRTPQTASSSRQVADDGITGTPFARVGSLDASTETTAGLRSSRSDGAENDSVEGPRPRATASSSATGDRFTTEEATRQRGDISELRSSEGAAAKYQRHSNDVVVGISRLHMVSIPALQMKPIYWSPINDLAVVLRATWFYRDTMIPIPTDVANQLEAGYQELRPYTQTWKDEVRCAIDVGPLGEEKVSHRLWPDDDHLSHDSDVEDAKISTDPFCAARCFQGEAAAQGSIDPEATTAPPTSQHKRFANYHVIYQDITHAFLLKPSLKPSAYYGRKPLAKIMKGVTVGIPVVRGFDRDVWERLHDKKPAAASKDHSPRAAPPHNESEARSCPACKAQKDHAQVTDLILVCHGIGQKFAERVESFHFTHAINAFRREVNLELSNPAVSGTLREDQNGIMVLPVNWRHTLSLEDGGPATSQGQAAEAADSFGLKDIEPSTIPAVRSMISDIMFDIPFYMSHHKGTMIEALVKEANRVYRLWCRNNPGFHEHGRVHLIGHSLGSAMAVDILSRQPNRPPALDLSTPWPKTTHFEFDTKNLFLAGSPAGFFLLLERGALLPRRGRSKPGVDAADIYAQDVTGKSGSFGCLAVDNIYNILAKEDPIAYLLNGTIDPVYAASLKTAYAPSTATSLFKYVGDTMRSLVTGSNDTSSAAAGVIGEQDGIPKPLPTRLPSQLEMEVHDFTREEVAERKAYLLNDNGQIDYYLRSAGGPLEIQYLNMLSAHSSYWASRDFIRMLCVEVGRKPGKAHTIPAMRAQKATKRFLGGS